MKAGKAFLYQAGCGLLAAALLLFSPFYAAAEGPVISGIIHSSVSAGLGTEETSTFLYGFEEYANLRLQANTGSMGKIFAAVNLVAVSGMQAAAVKAAVEASASESPPPSTSFTFGENYAAALELERLYVRISGEKYDADLGLMRIAFGFGQAFRPTDFLNPPNPLVSDARPRAVLGASVAFFPAFDTKVTGFSVGGPDPAVADGNGLRIGISVDSHFEKTSLQGLYSFQTPDKIHVNGLHRAGASVKLEAGAGIVLDALYTLDPVKGADIKGLEAAFGADYSIIDGKLYLLGQYLYNGPGTLDPDDSLDNLNPEDRSGFNRKNYLYAQGLYSYSDITRWGLACMISLDDLSFSPVLTFEHEPFQSLTVGITVRAAFDTYMLTGKGEKGELGPDFNRGYALATAVAKMRF